LISAFQAANPATINAKVDRTQIPSFMRYLDPRRIQLVQLDITKVITVMSVSIWVLRFLGFYWRSIKPRGQFRATETGCERRTALFRPSGVIKERWAGGSVDDLQPIPKVVIVFQTVLIACTKPRDRCLEQTYQCCTVAMTRALNLDTDLFKWIRLVNPCLRSHECSFL
jgi:hypothetical protein